MLPRPAFLLPALLLSGCILAGGDASSGTYEVEAARARWTDLGWENYDLRIRRMCYCMGAGTYDVLVRDDSVVAARPVVDDGYRLEPRWWSEVFPTVDGLLDIAARAEREADQVDVIYDENGWPVSIDIDWIEQAVDDEISYAVESVTPAPDGDVADLPHGGSVTLFGLTIRFDEVKSDSRCPSDVQCIWAGEASAQITVFRNRVPLEKEVVVVLSDTPLEGATTDHVEIDGVTIRLLAVTPYPTQAGTPIPPESYRVRILAERS